MAEFKLGRLRFVWKGTWSASTLYVKDDVIRYGGKVYVALLGHTANSNFYTDLNDASPKWALMADGITWIGQWTTTHYYKIGDIVSHGAKAWICLEGHTSGANNVTSFSSDQSGGKWTLLANGIAWKGTWSTNIIYNVNDIVKFGGKTYIAQLDHTSSSVNPDGFYTDLSANNWALFSDGIEWSGNWVASTYYKVGDNVKYGGRVYTCKTAHTSQSTLEADQSKWDVLVEGFNTTGAWATSTHYKVNDLVKYGPDQYICTTAHDSSGSMIDLTKFTLFVNGLEYLNSYSNGTIYALGDIVTYGGYVYQSSVTNNVGHTPSTNPSFWTVVTTGFELMGVWSSGTSYKTGDVVSYGAYSYVAKLDNTALLPPDNLASWTLLNTGIAWKGAWASGSTYKLGDAVSYASNSFICVGAHTSATGNRPDNDVGGTYWNSLTQGSATNVLTTAGDTVYYGGAGATRLPVGSEGQLMRVTSGYPAWYSYGFLNDVYYVAPTGTDSTSAGWSIDNPWKTIKYACQQVANGPANQSAQYLLRNNSAFMKAEIDNYLLYTYKVDVSGTSGNQFTTSNTSGLNVGMPIIFSNKTGITKTATTSYATQSLSVISSTGTTINVSSTMTGVTLNQPIVFSTSFGNIVAGTIYYVSTASGTNLTVSSAPSGAAFTAGSGGTGTASVQGTFVLNSTQYLTVNASLTFSGTIFGGVTNVTTYYISNIINSTMVTLSTSVNGAVITGVAAGTGTMPISTGNDLKLNGTLLSTSVTYYIQSIDPNNSFTVASSVGGAAMSATGTGATLGTFSYNSTKTRRDTVDIIDGICYDLGRGGNVETIINASKFFATSTTYTTTYFSYMIPQVVGCLTYLSTLVNDVMSNSAPANNYQVLMSVGSPVSQTIDLSYTAETGTITKTQSLIAIITTALSAGTTSAIPQSTKPSITINVKTGNYVEILPITVPAFVSIVGDELRSVVVQPYTFSATATTSASTTITLSDSTGIDINMGVSGNKYIPDGAYVTNVNGNIIQISQATTGTVTGNIIVGYTSSNMFLMRDGTVVRNMSVKGLIGGLSTDNSYGTKRPTSGAYFSLDPGTGTSDETVWINTRSPYMQNITLFGSGCTGMKVDGSLHAGGNRSMVANDFTNILSDGIAIWCSNNALVEAVSVFSYYGYAGYLSETGGYIRATNGNSSYGTYGVVAEGSSPIETPITGTVNTQSQHAQIASVLMGSGQILWLEYSNAGQSYSSATYSITSGTGVGASISANNYYTTGVTEVRMITGGANYITATGIGQSGSATNIIISAADAAATSAYNGMRIILTAGTGAGQYGYINTYNASTKAAIVFKESFITFTTTTCNTTTFSVASTTTIPVGTPIVFTGTAFGGITANVVYYVVAANFTSTTFSIATSAGGTAIGLTAGSGSMTINVAGWDVAVSGTSVQAALDGSTRYSIEPRVTFSGVGSGALARAIVSSNQISAIRIINPGTGYSSIPTMTITDPNATTTATWTVRVASGVLGQPTWNSRGSGYSDATVTITAGNGYSDIQPIGYFMYLNNLSSLPIAGSNIVFSGNSTYYSLVQILSYSGSAGNYSAYIQINPGLTVSTSPTNGTAVSITLNYSQARLTGHDFLYVGSGNYSATGFPSYFSPANHDKTKETLQSAGGRVFFTSTDQDGNFNVGNLFVVQQATGIATLSANLFNLSGLNNLQFASGGANITQFSTDGSMNLNSDSLVPTQRAVRAYIASQLGAGGSNITANSITAGSVYASGTTITTTNSNNLTIATSGSNITLGSSTSQITTVARGQTSFTPSASTDLVNKSYLDSSILAAKSFAYFMGK